MMRILKSGHKVEKLTEEDNKRMQSLLPLYESFIRLQPGGWFYPTKFADILDKYHEEEIRADDVFVVAIPKSGITWTLEIVWTLMHNPNLDNPEARRSTDIRTPHLELDFLLHSLPKLPEESESVKYLKEKTQDNYDKEFHGLSLLRAANDPRIIKSHVPLSLLPREAIEKHKVIYVVRDPRDTVISGFDYFYRFFHNYQGTIDDFIDNYLYAELYHHPYWNHVQEAYSRRNLPNILFIYYEDLKENPFREYTKISEFLGLQRTPQQVQNVVDYTRFANMKKLTEEGKVEKPCSDGGRLILKDQKVGFFRKGTIGGWKEALNEEQKAKLNDWTSRHIDAFPEDFKYKQSH